MTTWRVNALIMPKPGVNDPQGEAIQGGLQSLGFGQVQAVRAGKQISLVLKAESTEEAEAAVVEMCDQLLANPVTETYTVSAAGPVEEAATS